jgi:hypothetical protein
MNLIVKMYHVEMFEVFHLMQLFVDFGQKRKESLPIISIHQFQNHLQNIKKLNDNLHALKPQFKHQSNHIVCFLL